MHMRHPLPRRGLRRVVPIAVGSCIVGGLSGCAEPALTGGIVAGAVGGTTALGVTPGPELKQVIYLGSFDPQGQLPPEVYRITVRGQGSLASQVKFASGWVPAGVADALGAGIQFSGENSDLTISEAEGGAVLTNSTLGSGRRLVLFGPDGFRVAPKDHRLVIAMGSNANAYFEAVEGALGDVAEYRDANSDAAVGLAVLGPQRELDAELGAIRDVALELERQRTRDLRDQLAHAQRTGGAE